MGNTLTFSDLLLLIKQKKKYMLITAILFSVILGGLTFYYSYFHTSEETSESEEASQLIDYDINELLNTEEELLTDDQLEFIDSRLFEQAYSFRIYIENQDGSVYDRSNLLEELLLSSDTLNIIQEKTSVEIDNMKDYFLDIDLNSNNVIYTITVGLGDEETNQEVSIAYYEALQSNEIDIINNKVIKLFDTPSIVESEEEESGDPVETSDNQSSIVDVLISMFIGAVFGLGLGMFFAFISSLVGDKISPIYNYKLLTTDKFNSFSSIKMSEIEKYESLIHTILFPTSNKKLIISQNETLNNKIKNDLIETLDNHSIITTSVNKVDPSVDFDEIIVITENLVTKKVWYKKQSNQLRIYDKPMQVIKL